MAVVVVVVVIVVMVVVVASGEGDCGWFLEFVVDAFIFI